MPTIVLFSLVARRKLRQRTTRASATKQSALQDTMNDIEVALQKVFPKGGAAIVQDVYVSYRPRDGEFILLVELTNSGRDEDGLSVIKLGPADRLQKELDGWHRCRPHGLRHDLVLTTLEPRYHPAVACGTESADDRKPTELIALLYADAEQFIGVDQTMSLEAALLESTRLGVPTPESVADVLFSLYERLGLLLYRHSYTDDPKKPEKTLVPDRFDHRLEANLEAWGAKSGSAYEIRSIANSTAFDAGLIDQFVPPNRFAKAVIQSPATRAPKLLRGHAHGDLHGRNVLVGRVGDRVLWPAVFDYGDMGTDNLIGWDFVKMETEFKLRAYPILFPGKQQQFVPQVIRCEVELHQLTEDCRNADTWPGVPAGPAPRDRLQWLVLMIRRRAGQHLGTECNNSEPNRSREWLAEYYFLLAIYGLNDIRFDNLTDIQKLAAFLSAGCAAARYQWDRNRQDLQSTGMTS